MIIVLPEREVLRDDAGASCGFDLEHRRIELRPGSHVDEVLQRPGERHLHALQLSRGGLATASVFADVDLELWLLGHDHQPIQGPSNPLQAMLSPGLCWLQVRRPPGSRRSGGRYRLHLHWVSL